MDVDPPALNNLTIDGNLIADDTRDVTIIANYIHVRVGNFTAGSAVNPFQHKLTIQLNGNKSTTSFLIDPFLSANKLFVITGLVNFYGTPPTTTIASLTKTAFAGQKIIYVDKSTDWAVGDTLAFGPSFSSSS